MSDAPSFAELDGQQVELLPARTVLSMFTQGTNGGHGTDGNSGSGLFGLKVLNIPFFPGGGNGYGAPGGAADGGAGG